MSSNAHLFCFNIALNELMNVLTNIGDIVKGVFLHSYFFALVSN